MCEQSDRYRRLADIFKALGHPTRLRILTKTISGEFCVRDLQDHLDRSQPNVSRHLGVLRERGLVVAERAGKNVCYHPVDERISDIIDLAADIFGRADAS